MDLLSCWEDASTVISHVLLRTQTSRPLLCMTQPRHMPRAKALQKPGTWSSSAPQISIKPGTPNRPRRILAESHGACQLVGGWPGRSHSISKVVKQAFLHQWPSAYSSSACGRVLGSTPLAGRKTELQVLRAPTCLFMLCVMITSIAAHLLLVSAHD